MSAAAENVFRHGPTGIALFGECLVCGDRFRQPRHGRPRILCRKGECLTTHRRSHRRVEPPELAAFTAMDFDEAKRVWQQVCAICRVWRPLFPMRGTAILPVCRECRAAPLQGTPRQWLSRCRPGCPLPDPWKGGRG